jgi:hypothetical protein
MAVVIAENANLRGIPNSSGKVVTTIPRNLDVEIITQKGPWFLVQTPELVGWLHGDTIKLGPGRVRGGVPPAALPTFDESSLYVAPRPAQTKPRTKRTAPEARRYIRGPRGGCFYYSSGGSKVYVDRGLCS